MTTSDLRKQIWTIADGIPLRLDNMTIRTTDSGKLLVIGWTHSVNFQNITRGKVLQELQDLKTSFSELSNSFNELNDTIANNNLIVEYHMSYNDGGKAGIGLCSEIEGRLEWYID